MRFGMEILSPSSYFSNSSWLLDESKSAKWTAEENKSFENALARFDKDTPDRWQKVAAMVPGKTVADVRRQYKELVDDVSSIEAGLFPIPGYSASPFTLEWGNGHGFDGFKGSYGGGGGGGGGKRASTNRSSEQERKKGVPWTEEEHKLFLLGLKKYGKGDWRNISRNYVITRTPTQVASHAQKYFIRQHSGGKDKRRASIHDITTVNLNDDQSLSPDNKRAQSSEHVNTLPQQPISASLARTHAQWNQPNNGASALAYNQTHGNMYMAPPNYSNSYGLKVEHDSYMVPQNMGFQMQSGQHYPRR